MTGTVCFEKYFEFSSTNRNFSSELDETCYSADDQNTNKEIFDKEVIDRISVKWGRFEVSKMKLTFDCSRKNHKYKIPTNDEDHHEVIDEENGYPLTLILCLTLLLSCGTWTFAVWFSAKRDLAELVKRPESLLDNNQCQEIPVFLR